MSKHQGAEPQDEGRLGRKFALWSVAGFVVMALLLFLYTRDDALEDFSDLEPVPALTPAADAVFSKWQDVFLLSDEAAFTTETRADRHLLRRIGGQYPWRQEPVDRILAANQKMITAAMATDSLGAFRLPQESDITDMREYLSEMRFVAKLLKIHAIENHRNGDLDTAIVSAIAGLNFGDRALVGGSVLIDILNADSLITIAISALEGVASTHLSSDSLLSIDSALAVEPNYAVAAERALCNEMQWWFSDFADISEVAPYLDGAALVARLQYKRNRTTNTAAVLYRGIISQLHLARSNRAYPKPPAYPEGLKRLSSNAAGDGLLSESLPTLEHIIGSYDLTITHRRALRLKIAILRYQKDHGQPPSELSALVPDYLKSIPIDPFSDKPLHYDAKRGAIWSVGEDGVDNGGAIEQTHNGFGNSEVADPTLWLQLLPPDAEPKKHPSRESRRRSKRSAHSAEEIER